MGTVVIGVRVIVVLKVTEGKERGDKRGRRQKEGKGGRGVR